MPQAYFLDGVLFARVLPWYKERIRGPHLAFEHIDEELRSKSGWPPIGDCKNNEIKIGEKGFLNWALNTGHSIYCLQCERIL